ncbi:CaiB/BaiF CoA transferase family protein [Streptomyces brasiliensis]|uniref:CoA transferase n=1 Tax=Streptomyces brasiliensis TaxID=1954 RepID=A0A917L1K7_9ACTN|nr:CoA transferase [Streptomyces brasiliensis]GGJ40559.1 CoA transferase [Streptomyces brasiliensis]
MSVLSGYRVLDLSIAMAGPLATMRLGDLGADVLKIEPVTGEWQRHTAAGGATGNKVNAAFLSLNRNKRSLAVDLKQDSGRDLVYRLAARSDVFLQNYRPGVADRLGLDYESVRAVRPDIVYVSISGYGESGPYAHRPGQDLLLQGLTGALHSGGAADGPPQPGPYFVADAITAYSAFEGVLAALLHRERTGEGQRVSVNMLDAMIAMQMQELSVRTVGGVRQRRGHEIHAHTYIRAPYGIFPTQDGHLALAFADLAVLAEEFGDPALAAWDAERDGFTHREELSRAVAAHLLGDTTESWLRRLGGRGVWVGPVNSYDDVLDDPQVLHNGSFIRYEHPTEGQVTTPGFAFRMDRTPPALHRGAPTCGEHTTEILGELGLPAAEIEDLFANGVIA